MSSKLASLSAWVWYGQCGRSSVNLCFNYTYCTVAHERNMRQLFIIPASYENNIALAKLEGREAHARPILLLFSQQPFFPWPCAIVQLSFFAFLAIWSSFGVCPFVHAYIFVQGESVFEAFRRQSESEKVGCANQHESMDNPSFCCTIFESVRMMAGVIFSITLGGQTLHCDHDRFCPHCQTGGSDSVATTVFMCYPPFFAWQGTGIQTSPLRLNHLCSSQCHVTSC